MLVAWGTSCGRCRPKVARPKSPRLASGDGPALNLGWLVILSSPDSGRAGELHAVKDPVLVLSRLQTPEAPVSAGVLAFQDEFMSANHATIRSSSGQFTIEDRNNPGPSANGTFLNARKLEPGEAIALCDGDVIRLGTTEVFFRSLQLPGQGGGRQEDE